MMGESHTTCSGAIDTCGLWTNEPPTCEEVLCFPNYSSSNVSDTVISCSNGNKNESECNFSCDMGFYLDGEAIVTCTDTNVGVNGSTGEWDHMSPTCKAVICDPLVNNQTSSLLDGSGTCSDGNSYGSVCQFQCDLGYYLNGMDSIECNDDTVLSGAWTGSVPTCDAITCPSDIYMVENGEANCTDGNFFGSQCDFICNDGYLLDQDIVVTCGDGVATNGNWSDEYPMCLDVDECATMIDNCDENAVCSNTDGSFICTCNEGYQGDGTSCSVITCSTDVLQPANGDVTCTNGNKYNSSCVFTCDEDFDLSPQDGEDFVCTGSSDNGGWSTEAPSCIGRGPCAVNPCENGGICTENGDLFTCNCTLVFTGDTCSDDVDECTLNTDNCSENAECINTVGSYNCSCLVGFTGDGITCENIDDCANNPCENGGTCTDGINSFTCQCTSEYYGETCAERYTPCDPNPCVNGECVQNGQTFTCNCPPRYSGATCQIDLGCQDACDLPTAERTCTPDENCICSCECNLGYYFSNNLGACTIAQTFLGEMYFNTYNSSAQIEVMAYTEKTINEIYKETVGYEGATAIDYRRYTASKRRRRTVGAPEGVVTYAMDFVPTASVNEQDLETTYNNSIVRAAALQRPQGGTEFDVDTAKSAESSIVTNSAYNGCNVPNDIATLKCDTTSTNCVSNGLIATCECKSDYYPIDGSDTTCQRQFCSADSDCNNGVCDKESDGIYSCKCNWGFSGSNCNDAWLIAFTIVTPVLGVCLILAIIICYRARKRTKRNKKNTFNLPHKPSSSPEETPPSSVQYKSYTNPMIDEPIYATATKKSEMEKPPIEDDASSVVSVELRARL